MKKALISLGVVGLLLIGALFSYNGLVSLDEVVMNRGADVQTTYQRRFDLIPNLVETVKGYAAHEKNTLEAVVKARQQVSQLNFNPAMASPENLEKLEAAQASLTSSLQRLMVVVERYPDLKANQNFLELQSQIEGTENRINVARQRLNEAVREYNQKVRSFPTLVIARLLSFNVREQYKSDVGAEKAPKVSFN